MKIPRRTIFFCSIFCWKQKNAIRLCRWCVEKWKMIVDVVPNVYNSSDYDGANKRMRRKKHICIHFFWHIYTGKCVWFSTHTIKFMRIIGRWTSDGRFGEWSVYCCFVQLWISQSRRSLSRFECENGQTCGRGAKFEFYILLGIPNVVACTEYTISGLYYELPLL